MAVDESHASGLPSDAVRSRTDAARGGADFAMNEVLEPPRKKAAVRECRPVRTTVEPAATASCWFLGSKDCLLEPWPTELDARGDRPPHPLPALLAALEAIPAGHPQYIHTWTQPTELLDALSARGIEAAPLEHPDGTWHTRVQRRQPAAG